MQDFMTLRQFNINDASTILSWCKDKHAFRLWSADRYKDFPYGKQMLHLAIDYAKQELGAQKITLGVFCDNISAVECYKSVDFRTTGTDSYPIDGEDWKGFEMELML